MDGSVLQKVVASKKANLLKSGSVVNSVVSEY